MIQPIPGFDDSYYEENGSTVWEQEENYRDTPVKSFPETAVPLTSLPVSEETMKSFPVSGEPLTSLPVSGEPVISSPVSYGPVMPVSGEPVVSLPANKDILQFETTKVEPLFKVSLRDSQVDSQDNKFWSMAGKDKMDVDRVELKTELKREVVQNIGGDSWCEMDISENMKLGKGISSKVKSKPFSSNHSVEYGNIFKTPFTTKGKLKGSFGESRSSVGCKVNIQTLSRNSATLETNPGGKYNYAHWKACWICHKSFSDITALQSHLITRHSSANLDRVECPFCYHVCPTYRHNGSILSKLPSHVHHEHIIPLSSFQCSKCLQWFNCKEFERHILNSAKKKCIPIATTFGKENMKSNQYTTQTRTDTLVPKDLVNPLVPSPTLMIGLPDICQINKFELMSGLNVPTQASSTDLQSEAKGITAVEKCGQCKDWIIGTGNNQRHICPPTMKDSQGSYVIQRENAKSKIESDKKAQSSKKKSNQYIRKSKHGSKKGFPHGPKKEKMLKCFKCDRVFYSQNNLQIHLLKHKYLDGKVKSSPKSCWQCEKCAWRFNCRFALLAHMKRFRFRDCGAKKTKCLKCRQFQHEKDAKQHHNHQDCRKLCAICQTTFMSIEEADDHRKRQKCATITSVLGNKFTCLVCSKNFYMTQDDRQCTENTFCVHYFTFHCGGISPDVVMEKHKYECWKCGHVYRTMAAFRHHLNSFHQRNLEVFICTVCSVATCTYSELVEHTHSAHIDLNKEEKCDKCGLILDTLTIASHKIDAHDFQRCLTCHGVIEKRKIDSHVQNVHKNITYCCTICKMVFETKSELEFHNNRMELNIKEASEQYKKEMVQNKAWLRCPYGNCKVWYLDYAMLKEHINTKHLNAKANKYDPSLECYKCKALFCDQSTLEAHLLYKVCDSSQIVLKTKAASRIEDVSMGTEDSNPNHACAQDTRSDSEEEIDVE